MDVWKENLMDMVDNRLQVSGFLFISPVFDFNSLGEK